MRRTTICRSKAAIAFAAAVTGLASPAFARQNPPSPQVQQQPAPAAQPPARDTTLATPLSQLPATHLVGRGETLWSLAKQYFGDPLLWPEIYRLNTDVVEDPHWIFPGEELRITDQAPQMAVGAAPSLNPSAKTDTTGAAGQGVTIAPTADSTKAAQAAPAPGPVAYDGPTIFATANRQGPRQQTQNLEIRAQEAYRALRPGEMYSAGFLTEGRDLRPGRVLGTVQAPNIARLTTVTTALLYSQVAFDPPQGDSLHVGDVVMMVQRAGEIRDWGYLMKPTGLLKVQSLDSGSMNHHAVGQVIALYRQVHDGQLVLPLAPLDSSSNAHAVPVSDGITGRVIGLVDAADIAGIQDQVLIDRGAQDSVRLGDVFEISGTDKSRNELAGTVLLQAEGMVVNVQPKSCTVKLITVRRPDVRAGSQARLIRRMPS